MKTKKAIYNYLSESLPEILIIILGLIRIKFFLKYLGSDTLGLYQLYGQFFAYIAFAEIGFTSAALFSLYKPITEKNNKKINQMLVGINKIFKRIGLVMLLVGFILSFFVTFFMKDHSFNFNYVQNTFLLFLVINTLNYFYKPYFILYDAEQKKYIPNLIYQIGLLIKTIIEIVLIFCGCNLYVILIVSLIIVLLTNLFMGYYAKKQHPQMNLKEKPDYSMLEGTKHLIVHKISGLVANNIDLILVSKFIGLSTVVIYSAYNYIISALLKLINKISDSLYSIVGSNLIANKEDDNHRLFLNLNSFTFYVAILFSTSLIFAINPFINVFYGKDVVSTLTVAVLFVLILFLRINRQPLFTFTDAAGLFKETKICTITEAIINLSISLSLIKNYGMVGILLGTNISFLVADFIMKPRIIYKKLFPNHKPIEYYFHSLKFLAFFVPLFLINIYFINYFSTLLSWFFFSVIAFVLNIVIITIYYKLIKEDEWMKRIFKIFRRKNEN